MPTIADIRAALDAISYGERPNVGQASPVALEAWRKTRPDLTFEQFVELVAHANVEQAERQRRKASDRQEARRNKRERHRKKALERRRARGERQ